MLEAVIFDVDGTLVDSVDLHAECWKQAFEKYDVHVDFDQVRRLIGKGGDELIPSVISAEQQKSFGEEMNEFRSKLWKDDFASKVKPFPLVRELFEALKKNRIQIALGSSAKSEELKTYEKMLGVDGLVDARVTSDDVEKSKPAPDIFEAAMKKLKTAHARTRVVGDTPYDVRAANRAELQTVAVLCGGFPESELLAAGAVALFRDPKDLLAQLDRWATTPSQ